jgi:hypothetical protein
MDIGIVLLPNKQCSDFGLWISEYSLIHLPALRKLENIPHISLIHIANVDTPTQDLINIFKKFADSFTPNMINFPIKAIVATGGSHEDGYKWLDLQFEISQDLVSLRNLSLSWFCPLHNGILERMFDDINELSTSQLTDIENCGVIYSTYTPHLTAWYVDLPKEPKNQALATIASNIKLPEDLICNSNKIALVELSRNGNVISILNELPLSQTDYNYSDL